MRFDVDIEMTQGVYNTSESRLWTRFQKLFHKEIFERYVELRRNGTFTVDNFMKYYYDAQIAKVPEMDFNMNFYNKYLKDEVRRSYLFMMHGTQYEHMQRWIDQRLYFLDSYFKYGEDYESQATVRVEFADYDKEPITFQVQTFKPSYVTIVFKNSGTDDQDGLTVRKKVGRGQTIEFSKFITTNTDQEIRLFDARNLKSFGDVSKYTPKTVILDQAIKLTDLIVGTDEHPNPNLTNLSLGNNVYLNKIVADNCTAINPALDIRGCTNLESLSLKGSSVKSVLFPDGGSLQSVIFPKTLTSLVLKNLTVLDNVIAEGTENLTTVDIQNCPKFTGYINKQGEVVEGTIWNNLLMTYEPKDILTTLSFDSYGYISNYTFLDAVTRLANQRPDNFNLGGIVRYTGSDIPEMYSYYKEDFPRLTVKYPNVQNVSGMFQNYKNINAVWKRDEVHGSDDNQYTITAYYWTDLRDGEFPEESYYTYKGVKGRKLEAYDSKDMKVLADEIKERLSPFDKFTNANSMFDGMKVLEYLHDDTFDNIDLSECSTTYMFNGCENLKYFEIPGDLHKGLRQLNAYTFYNCYRAVIYIPETVFLDNIDKTAFALENYEIGRHPFLLFQSPMRYDGVQGIRDARYDVKLDPVTHRARKTKDMELYDKINKRSFNTEVEYFELANDSKILINTIKNKDNDSVITMRSLNIDDSDDKFSNPMNVKEFMPGSLSKFNSLEEIAIPTFDICESINEPSAEVGVDAKTKELDTSLVRLFNKDIIVSTDYDKTALKNIYVLNTSTSENPFITRYMFKNTKANTIYVHSSFKKIEEYAFDGCLADHVHLLTDGISNNSSLRAIYNNAFSSSRIQEINIPDTVTYMGDDTFNNCQNFTRLHFSNSMQYIPSGCFRNCLNLDTSAVCDTKNISGFNPMEITHIYDYAFSNAKNLMIFSTAEISDTGKVGPYDCYFAGGRTDNGDTVTYKNINYFERLEEIGKFAFNNIRNITRIDILDTINSIGAQAFYPPAANEAKNKTLLQWKENGDFSSLSISSQAFANRRFSWQTGDQILEEVCYIPSSVLRIDENAFTPYTREEESAGIRLDFVLTEISQKDALKRWDKNFVRNCLRVIYDFNKIKLYEDDVYKTNMLYFLRNDKTALAARLLTKDATGIYLPRYIADLGFNYEIKEILDEAFVENDTKLNNIVFANDSTISRLGNSIFDTDSIIDIFVTKPGLLESSGKIIPSSIIVSKENPEPIGKNIPFKKTSWFKNILKLDDFVYLNEYCIGYSKNKVELVKSDKHVKDSIKFIYEYAFSESDKSNNLIQSFRLPNSLHKICNNAFEYCKDLRSISFKNCRNTLEVIDDQAFTNCYALQEIFLTENIKHVGFGAFSGCNNMRYVHFADNISLDVDSYPLDPSITNPELGLNDAITKVVIPESMGRFFEDSAGTSGAGAFKLLTNVSDLVLGGTIDEDPEDYTINLELSSDPGHTDEYYIDFSKSYHTKSGAPINLAKMYPHAKYGGEILGSSINSRIYTKKNYFILPQTKYNSSIDLSVMTRDLYDDGDILRILLGFDKKSVNTISAKSDFINRARAGKFSAITTNRISFNIIEDKE